MGKELYVLSYDLSFFFFYTFCKIFYAIALSYLTSCSVNLSDAMLIAPPRSMRGREFPKKGFGMLCYLRYVFHRLAYYGRRQKLSLLFCLSLPATPHFATYITYICSRSYSKSFGERFFSCQCQQRYYLDTCCATVTATYKPKMQCGLVLLVVTESLFECKKSQRKAAKKDQRFF